MDQFEDDTKPKKTWTDFVWDVTARWNGITSELAITIWAVSLCLVVATLMVGHWITLPHPEVGDQFETHQISLSDPSNLEEATEETSPSNVFAYHFLYETCPCSKRVLRSVLNRRPTNGAIERVVLIAEDKAESANSGSADENISTARSAGFRVTRVTPKELKAKYNIESAPLLVVTNEKGEIIYSGGYTSRKQGLGIQDVSIIASIISGKHVESLPVYGCAVSKELQAILDPFRLKYASK